MLHHTKEGPHNACCNAFYFPPWDIPGNQVLIFAILISLRLKIYKWSNTSYVPLYLTISFRIMFFWSNFLFGLFGFICQIFHSHRSVIFHFMDKLYLSFTIYLLMDICAIPNIWWLTLKLKWKSIGMLCVFICSGVHTQRWNSLDLQ